MNSCAVQGNVIHQIVHIGRIDSTVSVNVCCGQLPVGERSADTGTNACHMEQRAEHIGAVDLAVALHIAFDNIFYFYIQRISLAAQVCGKRRLAVILTTPGAEELHLAYSTGKPLFPL